MFLFGGYRHGDAVLVRATDKNDVFALQAKVSDINIGRQVSAGKVAEVKRPVSVRKGRRDKSAGKLRVFGRCF
jgi:hypothetical protein